MKKHFLIILLLAVIGCQKNQESDVELLSKREMVDILIDIHILEAKVNKLRLRTDSAKAVYNSLEDELFVKHEVDKQIYERSYQYYLVNTKQMQEIYDVVVDSLNLRHQRASVSKSAEKEDDMSKKEIKQVEKAREIRRPNLNRAAKSLKQVAPVQLDSSSLN